VNEPARLSLRSWAHALPGSLPREQRCAPFDAWAQLVLGLGFGCPVELPAAGSYNSAAVVVGRGVLHMCASVNASGVYTERTCFCSCGLPFLPLPFPTLASHPSDEAHCGAARRPQGKRQVHIGAAVTKVVVTGNVMEGPCNVTGVAALATVVAQNACG
jgi:hypothetical protein